MLADAPLVVAASALPVVMLAGWNSSAGVAVEIKAFRMAGKPMSYLDSRPGWLANT